MAPAAFNLSNCDFDRPSANFIAVEEYFTGQEGTDDENLPEIAGPVFIKSNEKDRIEKDVLIKENANLRRGRQYEREHPSLGANEIDEVSKTNGIIKEFKNDHDKKSFGNASFNMVGYFVGLSTLLILSVSVIKFLISKSKPGTKEL